MPQTLRTPPSASATAPTNKLQVAQVQQSSSEPDLSRDRELEHADTSRNITLRCKRKRDDDDLMASMEELKSLFTNTMAQQESRFSALISTVTDIKNQNESIRQSLDFITEEYERLKQCYTLLEKEKKENALYIQSLESRIDNLERNIRAASIEIRSVPQQPNESKEQLCDLVKTWEQPSRYLLFLVI